MKKIVSPVVATAAPQSLDGAAAAPGAAQLHASPHMLAQRAQLAGAFGAAQLAGKKKLPAQRKAEPAAQLKTEKKKPGAK